LNEINEQAESIDLPHIGQENPPAEEFPNSPIEESSLEATSLEPKPSTLRYIFFGADGLRAGWGLLLYIAMIAGCFYSVHLVQMAVKGHHAAATSSHEAGPSAAQGASAASGKTATAPPKLMSPRAGIIGEGAPFLVVMLATFVMSRIERRRFGVYGLGGTNRLAQFLAGLFWGVVCLSLLVGLLHWSGFLEFDARLLSGGAALRYGLIWGVGFILVALLEESVMRGYAQYTLARGFAGIYGAILKNTRHRDALGFWTAAIVLSFVFGLGHSSNPGESPIGELGAGLAGLVFCFALYRTGSLWWAIGIHAAWDWSQSFLYGVADSGLMAEGHLFATRPVGKPILSGGLTGPEGSIFCLLMLAVIAVIIGVTLPTKNRRNGAEMSTTAASSK
jgi:membrane protease YdiL (CAAX protease family)